MKTSKIINHFGQTMITQILRLIVIALIFCHAPKLLFAEIGCPHSAASQLHDVFVEAQQTVISTAAAVEKGRKGWAYIYLSVESVPGLKADGNTLDFKNMVDAPMVIYPSRKQKSFWMYRDGEMVHTHDELSAEGVDDLSDIIAELRDKQFVLAEVSGQAKWTDAVWTNTIFMHSSDVPKSRDFSRFIEISGRFLSHFNVDTFCTTQKQNTSFITVAKNHSGETLLTIFKPDPTRTTRKLVGMLHVGIPGNSGDTILNYWAQFRGNSGDTILNY